MADVSLEMMRRRVRVVMDENSTTQALLSAGDVETLSLDDLIDENVLTAVRDVEMRAPWAMLDGVSYGDDADVEGTGAFRLGFVKLGEGKYMGRMALPGNMLRLLAVKLKSWNECARLITSDDAAYRWQRSKWSGVGGSPEKPVAAVVPGPGGGVRLETYSSADGDDCLQYVTLVEEPVVEKDTIVGVSQRLLDAIEYLAAAMTCSALGDAQTAAQLEATAWRLAGVLKQ